MTSMTNRNVLGRALLGGLAALLVAGMLTGCNTLAGVGQDVEEGGEAVQEAAQG